MITASGPPDLFESLEAKAGWLRTALTVALVVQAAGVLLYFAPIKQPPRWRESFGVLCADPFTTAPIGEPSTRHRILAPLIAYALGLRGPQGVVVLFFANFAFLVLLYRLMRRHLAAGQAARAVGLLGTTLVVLSSQTMLGYPDSLGHLAILGCLYIRSPWPLVPMLVLGLLGEERCILATPLVLVWHYLEDPPERRWPRLVARGLSIAVAFGAWLLLRMWMHRAFHVVLPDYEFIGRRILFRQYTAIPAAYYFALRAAWLPVFLVVVDWRGRVPLLLAYGAAILVALVPGMFVMDTSRSMAFAYPAVLIALVELSRRDRARLWGVLDSALLLNLFTPQYNVVLTIYFPLWPLPLALIEWLFDTYRLEGVWRLFAS
jgi:hypothetical protein